MSDFGKIMDEWESRSRKKRNGKEEKPREKSPNPMELWLSRNSVEDKDQEHLEQGSSGLTRRELLAMAPQDRLDLHGYLLDEALSVADEFIRGALKKGFRKVLIIHGKGHHSPGKRSVLKKGIRLFLERNPRVGEFGSADRTAGGEGATWVILRGKG